MNRDEREEQNLITRRNTSLRDQQALYALNGINGSKLLLFFLNLLAEFLFKRYLFNVLDVPEEDFSDRLQFHPRCGTHAAVIRSNRTAHRPK